MSTHDAKAKIRSFACFKFLVVRLGTGNGFVVRVIGFSLELPDCLDALTSCRIGQTTLAADEFTNFEIANLSSLQCTMLSL